MGHDIPVGEAAKDEFTERGRGESWADVNRVTAGTEHRSQEGKESSRGHNSKETGSCSKEVQLKQGAPGPQEAEASLTVGDALQILRIQLEGPGPLSRGPTTKRPNSH